MKTQLFRVLAALTLCAGLQQAAAQGTAFTYQGQLQNNGSPANGTYDMRLLLFSALTGGSQVGNTQTNIGVGVTNGLFILTVDFGPVFTGPTNWLRIDVRTNGGSSFTQLAPRQQLTPAPYAIFAGTAGNVSGVVASANLSGTYGNALTLNNAANSFTGNGGGLTGLNASQLTGGTVPDAELSGNVALLNGNQSFTGSNTFSGLNASLTISGTGPISTSLYTGLGFQFYNNSGEGAIMSSVNDANASLTFYTKQGPGFLPAKQMKVDRYGVVMIDQQNANNGVLNDGTTNGVGLNFGSNSGEGIASQRTAGVNQYGLDFYTAHTRQMSILNNGNVGIGTTNPTAALQVNGTVAATTLSGNGSGLTNLNASLVGGLAVSNFWQTTGNAGTSPGVNFLGTSDNKPLILEADGEVSLELQYNSVSSGSPPFTLTQSSINLIGGYWGNSISSGVVGGTIAGGGGASRLGINNYTSPNTVTASFGTVGGGVGNTAGSYATVPGGVANVASGEYSFAAGQQAQALNQGAFVWADSETPVFASTGNDQFLIRAQGGVGIGTASPEQALSVNGGLNLDQAGLNAGFVNNGNTNGNGLTFGVDSGEGIASDRVSGVNRYGLDFYTDFAHRISILQNGMVGIGLTNPSTLLEVNGNERVDGGTLYLEGPGVGSFSYDGLTWGTAGLPGINAGYGPFLAGYEGGAVGALNPNTICMSWDSSGDVWVSNNCSVASLNIRGGADLAEPFNISSANSEVPEGAVVVIDEQDPGHLKLSDRAYDPRVAGIVSGANGIHPGIQMHQQGIIEGGKNVALSGRVYVQADTSNGAIKPGDLLTTSGVPGYAMKVTNHARAAGAILGKAMTGLNKGQGMVLVLVTLQ